jgi:hypothetical protein
MQLEHLYFAINSRTLETGRVGLLAKHHKDHTFATTKSVGGHVRIGRRRQGSLAAYPSIGLLGVRHRFWDCRVVAFRARINVGSGLLLSILCDVTKI